MTTPYIEITSNHYMWWEKRVRQDIPLSEEELTVIENCSGLYALWTKGQKFGFNSVPTVSINDACHCNCSITSICKTGSS